MMNRHKVRGGAEKRAAVWPTGDGRQEATAWPATPYDGLRSIIPQWIMAVSPSSMGRHTAPGDAEPPPAPTAPTGSG